jgi:hypothetical protein
LEKAFVSKEPAKGESMLNLDAQIVAQGNQTIDIQVMVTAPLGESGIESVKITTVDGIVLAMESPANCPQNDTIAVKGIPSAALPVYVEATPCAQGVDQGQLDQTPTVKHFFGPVLDCTQNQNNPTCDKVKQRIIGLRGDMAIKCGERSKAKNNRDAAAAVVAASLTAAAALAVAAAAVAQLLIIGKIIAAALLIVAALLLIAAGIAGAVAAKFQVDMDKIFGQLTQDSMDLLTLIGRLNDVCCPEALIGVPLDIPLCP